MTNLIDERDERTRRRKQDKKRFDSEIALSHNTDKKTLSATMEVTGNTIRLLDEGAVVGDGYIDFYIKKGTLAKFLHGENEYLDNLPDDYIGNVNLGHLDFATFPFVIGEFTLDDLHLVDIGDERQGLDVDLRIDEDSVFVKELARQPYDIAISSEFYYHADDEATADMGFLVIDEVLITAYGLVGEPGNVNSDGLELKGGKEVTDIKKDEVLEEKDEVLEEELSEEVEETEEDKQELSEEVETPVSEEVEEEADEEVEGEETNEVSEEAEDEEDGDEENDLEKVEETFNAIQEENTELKAKIEVLEKKNKKLQKKFDAKCEEIDTFAEKFKGLSASTGLSEEKKEEKVETLYKGSNGIGEL